MTRIDDGKGGKDFFQSHWNDQQWVSGVPDSIKRLIPIYRYQQVRKAISEGEPIVLVEGEVCADKLWALGIAATTTIGGSKGYKKYGDYAD